MPGESVEAVVSSWTGHNTDIMRFATAGSVYDGNNTLIGPAAVPLEGHL